MAEASRIDKLEENLTCSICFNVYRDPHELTCSHTLCLECINQLQHDDQVECPECRMVSQRTQVKKDFQAQKFIDVLNESEKKQENKATFLDTCEVCEELGRPITSICTTCNQYMCRACEKAHHGSKATKTHPITSTQQLTEQHEGNLKKTLTQVDKQTADILLKLKDVDSKMSDINQAKEQQLTSLHQYEEELIQDIKNHCSEMSKKISELNDSVLDNYALVKNVYQNSLSQSNSHRDIITDLINTKDATTLIKTAELIDCEIKQNIKEIHKKLSKQEMPIISPVTVERGNKWDCNTGPQVTDVNGRTGDGIDVITPTHQSRTGLEVFTPTHQSRTGDGLEVVNLTHSGGISLMLQHIYKRDKTIRFTTCPIEMCFVNDNIWKVDRSNNIKTYDYNLQHIKTTKVKADVNSITWDRLHEQVVTAHGDDIGIHQYDLQGHHIHQICIGDYSHVIIHDSKLYALSYKQSPSLHMFTYNNNQWRKHSQVSLNYDNKGSPVDKMCIIGDCVYVSSWKNDCIYTFSLKSGELQHTAGKGGRSGSPGELNLPRISGCHDVTGDILVADNSNHRLQVYNSTQDKWSAVRIEDGMMLIGPFQALLDLHADNMWVITGSQYLIRYTSESH